MIRVSAFRWVPPFAQGLVRDLRVRWALEEAGLAYETLLIGFEDRGTPDYRALQPFGQVPAFEEEDEGGDRLALFESGAIVLHIAERSEVLLPRDPAARARAIPWMFAALNSIEQHVQAFALVAGFLKDEEWAKLRRPSAQEMAEKRLDELAARLGEREWLDDRFTAGDLLMTSVLRILRGTDLIAARPTLAAYQARGEARPAFQRALAAQLAPFAENAPAA
ncbi:MAG: glutathione S-transferase family protein [Alphaproteobacteria bacterium]|nr:glutathione S-transferase family protein [Alphaproteobacteria bacterium]